MLGCTDPREAYRRSAIDARIHGGDAPALVEFCLDQAVESLGVALSANERHAPAVRSKALTRAMTAITALEMGVDDGAPLAKALYGFYRGARQIVLDSVISTDCERLAALRRDLTEVRAAFRRPEADALPAA